MDDDESKIAEKYEALRGVMDEQMRRFWAASEARALGSGGEHRCTGGGAARPTITAGLKELGDARQLVYPDARELLITADGGGSNVSRARLWKVALQRTADATGLKINVCHLPPGTSKWNKIEHRMFCHITRN